MNVQVSETQGPPIDTTRLAAAILSRAVKDWTGSSHETHRYKLITFFHSAWFIELCEFLELDPKLLLEKLYVPKS